MKRSSCRFDDNSKAPRARSIPAWGEAPGMHGHGYKGLKARPIGSAELYRSGFQPSGLVSTGSWGYAPCWYSVAPLALIDSLIPNVAFINFDAVLLEKCAEFVLEVMFAVMGFLGIDVMEQRLAIGRADRKGGIASLPSKLWHTLGLHPSGGRRFQFRHKFRNVLRSGETNRDVNVIDHAAHTVTFAVGVTDDSSEIGVEVELDGRGHQRAAVFGAEDDMDQDEAQRLGHGENYKSGLQPEARYPSRTWGCAPGWYSVAPLALRSVVQGSVAPSFVALRFVTLMVVAVSVLASIGCNAKPATAPVVAGANHACLRRRSR
jgi:hypothetical protein